MANPFVGEQSFWSEFSHDKQNKAHSCHGNGRGEYNITGIRKGWW
jgi:hypothetical protein